MNILLKFSSAINEEHLILQQMKTEDIIFLLTSLDEAFIILLIVTFFEERVNTNYTESHEEKIHR